MKKAKYLYGDTHYQYDVNGQLTRLDRGRPKGARYNSVGEYAYDNEGKILERVDKGGISAAVGQYWGYANDPAVGETYTDDDGFSRTGRAPIDVLQGQVFGEKGSLWWANGYDSAKATYHSYAYADGNPVADVKRESTLSLKSLALDTGEALAVYKTVTTTGEWGTPVQTTELVGYQATLKASDLRYDGEGRVDRRATAMAVADRLYGLSNLAANDAKDGLATAIEAKLPETLAAGATFMADRYMVVLDRRYDDSQIITDYAYHGIGGKDGLGGGSAQRHTVIEGQDLKAIAANYYGSSSYWYLIADANGLSGNEELVTGTQLTLPNIVTNSLNDKDTYKVYNKSEIIGSDDPVVRVKQKSSGGGFFASIVKILIVVIVVVAAVYVAAFAAGMMSAAMGAGAAAGTGFMGAMGAGAAFAGTTTGLAGMGIAATALGAAAVGYAAGVVTSFATQGIAIMAGLQEEFDWKGMRDMGSSFAVTALAGAAGQWAGQAFKGNAVGESIARASIQAGSQQLRDGEVTNFSGIAMAFMPGISASAAKDSWIKSAADYAVENKDMVGAGLAVIEASINGNPQTLAWTSFASAAVGGQIGQGYYGADGYNWNKIAGEAVLNAGLSMIVASEFGEDAGFNFFGSNLGNTVAGVMDGKYAWDNSPKVIDRLVIDPNDKAALRANPELRQQFAAELQRGGTAQSLASRASDLAFTANANAQFALEGLGLSPDVQAALLGDEAKMAEFGRLVNAGADPMALATGAMMLAGPSASIAPRGALYASNSLIMTDAAMADGTVLENYTVKKGDSFWRIAARELGEGASSAAIQQRTLELMAANPGLDPRRLQAGRSIQLTGGTVDGATVAAYNTSDAVLQRDLAAFEPGLETVISADSMPGLSSMNLVQTRLDALRNGQILYRGESR